MKPARHLRRLAAFLALMLAWPSFAAGLRVVTTIPPVYCFAANVAGSLATVENLLPPGADAHDFQFSFVTRRKLEQADLILSNGLGLESWLAKAMQKSGPKRVVRCADGFDPELIPPHGRTPNPHVWLDPRLACRMVTNILVAFQQADPTNASAFATNAAAYVARLQKLDEEIRFGLAALPGRAFVTWHDAFPYLARRYGLTVAGVVEETAGVDPSPFHLGTLRVAIQKQGVKALFVDAHVSARRARQLGSDFRVAVGVLDTLETAPLSASSYEDGMKRNLRALQEALK